MVTNTGHFSSVWAVTVSIIYICNSNGKSLLAIVDEKNATWLWQWALPVIAIILVCWHFLRVYQVQTNRHVKFHTHSFNTFQYMNYLITCQLKTYFRECNRYFSFWECNRYFFLDASLRALCCGKASESQLQYFPKYELPNYMPIENILPRV